MQCSLVPAKDAVRLVALGVERARGVRACATAAGGRRGGLGLAHLLEALLGTAARLLGDVGVVDGGLEACGNALLWIPG